jgi:hypothetical protein
MRTDSKSDHLVISRGQWDKDAAKEESQFSIEEGRMKLGSRLGNEGATVARSGILTDGPYGETKEVIGGFWSIVAGSLDEAARIAAENPCLRFGLFYEIRPTDSECASAYKVMTETPCD